MKTQMDSWLKAQAPKRAKKPIRYWRVWSGANCIDEGVNIAILKAMYAGQNVTFKPQY